MPYRPEHQDACLALFDGNTPPFFDPTERAAFRDFLGGDPHPYFVLTQGAQVVACGGLALPGDAGAGVELPLLSAGLKWGMVARGAHGVGIGSRLLELRLDWLRAHAPEVREVRLATSQFTAPFYARHGFAELSRDQDGFARGLHRIVMRRALGTSAD